MVAEILFLSALALLVWTYLGYPCFVHLIAFLRRRSAREAGISEAVNTDIRRLSVLIPARNEEAVIMQKIKSVLESDYPADKIEIVVGSDASDDNTDSILTGLTETTIPIKYFRSGLRVGKATMLNSLAEQASGEILVISDANVIFEPATLSRLASCFSTENTGISDATVIPLQDGNTGVLSQENSYSDFETRLRRAEVDAWGSTITPYGGCYAIRKELFPVIPPDTLVDDMFVGLSVLEQGYLIKNCREAVVYEDTRYEINEQYRRRVRIATGSFQNLFRFGPLPSSSFIHSTAFFSHKVMRWISPFFIIAIFMTSVILSRSSVLYFYLLLLQLIFIILSALDWVYAARGGKIKGIRYMTQFLMMNAALAEGFLTAVKGVKNGIWEPTKRG